MKQYKGYYIDNVIFHSETEIDDHIKANAVEDYKRRVEAWEHSRTLESAVCVSEKAEILVNNFGFTWEEVEMLEVETLQAIA